MACIQVWFTPDFCFKLREDLLHYLIRPRDDTITIAAGPLFINTTFLPMSKVNASFDSRCDDDYTHQRGRPVLLFPMLLYPFSNQDAFYRRPSFFYSNVVWSLSLWRHCQMEKNEFSLRSWKETSLTVMSVDSRKGHNNGENVEDKLEDLYSAPEYLNYTHGSQNATFRAVDPSTVDLVRVTLSTIATATYITGT